MTKEPARRIVLAKCLGGIFTSLASPLPSITQSAEVPAAKNVYLELHSSIPRIENRLKNWRLRSQKEATELKTSANPAIARWRKLVLKEAFRKAVEADLETLQDVNTTINASVRYISDYRHFHKMDFWATAETTLVEGGDCEDIALLKSTTLDWLGWPVLRKHLLIGVLHRKPPRRDEAHAVLMIEFENDPTHWVMDSIGNTLTPLSEFNFTPLHAVDSQTGLRLFLKTRSRRHN